MEWGDVLTLFLVAAGVWYLLIPASVRASSTHAAAEAVRAAWRGAAPTVRWLAYDVLLGVKGSEEEAGTEAEAHERGVMSRSESESRPSGVAAPSVLRTDDANEKVVALPSRDQMLAACRVLRAKGLTRDEGRAFFKGLGLPLGNDVWSEAAQPVAGDEDDYVTPIAGRRTKARYYDDSPELEYQSPPV